MNRAQRYTYRVWWSSEDSQYVATIAEFPSLSWLSDTQESALQGAVSLVTDILQDMDDNGEEAPEPLGSKSYSGKFQVRITPEAHRRIAMEAAEEGVSLNRLVASRL